MTGRYEPVLHALSIEPRSARPGETIRVAFRARNLGTLPSPPATVVFALPDGLDALDVPEVEVEAVAPGEHVVAAILARVATPLDDRTELAVQAALRRPGAELGTNVCVLVVRSRPVLNGPASGTFVEALNGDTVRVRAVVVNEGDGPARDVRVVVPAPLGCARRDGGGPAVLERERLDAGDAATLEFDARIVAPLDAIRADDGAVWTGERMQCFIPVREGVVPEPLIAPPDVEVRASRRRADVRVEVRNEGWAEAREVALRITLPNGLKLVDGGVVVDGVAAVSCAAARRGNAVPFARLVRYGDGCTIVLASVPARGSTSVVFAAASATGRHGGTLGVTAGPHERVVSCIAEPRRAVRVSVTDAPRSVGPGELIHLRARVVNAGDVAETLRLTASAACGAADALAETQTASRTLAPGFATSVPLAVRIAHGVAGSEIVLRVVVSDADGERGSVERLVAVRRTADVAADEPLPPPAARSDDAVVHASLVAPNEVVAGAPFGVRIVLDVEDDADTLVVRVPASAGTTYVSGSTVLDGCALLDGSGRSRLEEGLVLRAVPAGTRVTVAWFVLADAAACDTPLELTAAVEVDGTAQALPGAEIRVTPCDPFAMRPTGLRYHVEASAATARDSAGTARDAVLASFVGDAEAAVDAVVVDAASDANDDDALAVPRDDLADAAPIRCEAEAETPDELGALLQPRNETPPRALTLRLDADRAERVERLAGAAPAGGLVMHVLAAGGLLPDGISGAEGVDASFADVRRALCDVRHAVEDVCDRLFVKLRIPGFYVAADDLEDPALRRALTELFERLCAALTRSPGTSCGVVDSARAAGICALLAHAPYGAPAVLRTLIALVSSAHAATALPDAADGPSFAAALERYMQRLDDVLARYEGVPLELFEDALARGSDRVLDGAHDALQRTVRAAFTPARLAC